MTIKGKTWSHGTNSRLPFGVNVNLNLSLNKLILTACIPSEDQSYLSCIPYPYFLVLHKKGHVTASCNVSWYTKQR